MQKIEFKFCVFYYFYSLITANGKFSMKFFPIFCERFLFFKLQLEKQSAKQYNNNNESMRFLKLILNYNWLSFRVVDVVVVIFSVSPFSWPFDIDVMIDFTTTVFELVSVVSLQEKNYKLKIEYCENMLCHIHIPNWC